MFTLGRPLPLTEMKIFPLYPTWLCARPLLTSVGSARCCSFQLGSCTLERCLTTEETAQLSPAT